MSAKTRFDRSQHSRRKAIRTGKRLARFKAADARHLAQTIWMGRVKSGLDPRGMTADQVRNVAGLIGVRGAQADMVWNAYKRKTR